MADTEEKKDQNPEAEAEAKPKKKGLLMAGGFVGVLGLAFMAAMMAVPGKSQARRLMGPFTSPLTEDKLNVNLRDNQSKRYLQFKLHCEYYTYDPAYYNSRLADPLYQPRLIDALQRICSSLSVEDVTGKVNKPLVIQEMVVGINTVLFPIHIGETRFPSEREEESGLRPGFSSAKSTFTGYFDEHVLHVDGPQKKIRIDDGPDFVFEGTENDLEIVTRDNDTLYIDVSAFEPEFKGEVHVGRQGHLQNLLIEHWILQ